jgi:hypothetical protein
MSILRKQLKILNAIIRTVPIHMVDSLLRFKESSKMLLHNQVMFTNVSCRSLMRMIGTGDKNVTTYFYPSTFPSPTIGALGLHDNFTFRTTGPTAKLSILLARMKYFTAILAGTHRQSVGRKVTSFSSHPYYQSTLAYIRTRLTLNPFWWTSRNLITAYRTWWDNLNILYSIHSCSIPQVTYNIKGDCYGG